MGKRPDESEADTARRRGRSVDSGVKLAITMHACGRRGIGRVAGNYNSAGTNLPGYDDPAEMEGIKSDEARDETSPNSDTTRGAGLQTRW